MHYSKQEQYKVRSKQQQRQWWGASNNKDNGNEQMQNIKKQEIKHNIIFL